MNGTTIFDIAPPEIGFKEIEIRGKKLPVHGISAEDWVTLYRRYPDLVRGAVTGISAINGNDVSPIEMVKMEAAICAAGFGQLGKEDVELAVINNLSREERQQVMVNAIDLSRPGDTLGPLLAGDAAEEMAAVAATGNSG